MPRGGYRPGSGPKKGTKYRPRKPKTEKPAALPPDIQSEAAAENLSPLDYMLKVINSPLAASERKDRLAVAAAPYVHAKPGEKGKKEGKEERATKAGAGKFAPGPTPLKVVK